MGHSKKGVFYPRQKRRPPDREGMKWCGSCQQYKEAGDVKDGSSNRCSLCRREKHQRVSFGITKEDQAIIRTVELCQICFETGGAKGLGIDHDHETGQIRGMLCFRCNQAIGLLRDCPARVMNALDYLNDPPFEKHGLYVRKQPKQVRFPEYKYVPVSKRKE